MVELSLDKLAAVGSTPTLVRLVFHREEKRLTPKRDAREIDNYTLFKNNGRFTVHYHIITDCSHNSMTS